ncbi:MAG: hypothetical protein PUC11_05625 [Elusimicrobia bacterium]|nr:hypothetical protein [Elusimicrobiota bacterium]
MKKSPYFATLTSFGRIVGIFNIEHILLANFEGTQIRVYCSDGNFMRYPCTKNDFENFVKQLKQ